MSLATTDEDVAREFGRIINIGSVYGPYPRKDGRKTVFAVQAHKRDEVLHVLRLFRPWLGERRTAQVDAVLEIGGT